MTVTLPERTLAVLDAIDRDRARAIVRVTDALSTDTSARGLVDVVEVTPGLGIILVGPSRLLRRIPWLRLVELTPARYLLSIPSGTPVELLEVALHDLIEATHPAERDRTMLERLGALVRTLRRRGGVSKAEMLFVDTHRRAEWDEAGAPETEGASGTAVETPPEPPAPGVGQGGALPGHDGSPGSHGAPRGRRATEPGARVSRASPPAARRRAGG